MFFQMVFKGIAGLSDNDAQKMLLEGGIMCRWWHRVRVIKPQEIKNQLSETNLFWHLERYDNHNPATGRVFSDDTPFISTTAGAVERDQFHRRNVIFPPFMTALKFATNGFNQPGHIFFGYVLTLGMKAVELQEFAEEVRELHVYTSYLRFHDEGEIVAKIHIPSKRLKWVRRYDPNQPFQQVDQLLVPPAQWSTDNPEYIPPERFANIRGLLA